jgi:hypothetical protein
MITNIVSGGITKLIADIIMLSTSEIAIDGPLTQYVDSLTSV